MTDLKKVLAFNMKQHRKILGFTQEKLAELVDVSENYIALIETGRRFPSYDMMIILAQALKIDVLELFSIESIKSSENKVIKDVILKDIDRILTEKLLS